MHEKGKEWHRKDVTEVARALHTDPHKGLTEDEAANRLIKSGKNDLPGARNPFWAHIGDELRNPLALLLFFAVLATLVLREYVDAAVIAIAAGINIALALYQRGRADRAFEKLRGSEEHYAVAIREGKKIRILAEGLVPGDLIVVEGGMRVSADARITISLNCSVSEASLTGEWDEVQKDPAAIDRVVPLAERTNMLFMGTLVTEGSATAIVTATGVRTEFGHIVLSLLEGKAPKTPLEATIARIARIISILAAAALCILIMVGLFRGNPFDELLLTAIAIAVAAVPEGLPAAVTVVLAVGMESVLRRGGLVRNLLAAETLGSTTVILTDKTGTLTKAEMRVGRIVTLGSLLLEERSEGAHAKHEAHGDERDILEYASLASDAFIEKTEEITNAPVVHGRPVERAIVEAAYAAGVDQTELLVRNTRLAYLPFSSKERVAISLNEIWGLKQHRIYATGAPDIMFDLAQSVYLEGKAHPKTKEIEERFHHVIKRESDKGMRLIGVAFRDTSIRILGDGIGRDKILGGMVFGGLIVLSDPIRSDVQSAIKIAKEAGTRVIMVTGDDANTACAVAEACGIWAKGSPILRGPEIADRSDEELARTLKNTNVLARMLPEDKLRIVRILEAEGEVVAMTGDGINDAPALRAAAIGVALGSGSDVAKEASDLILKENSFGVIVAAIEEGRRVADNIRKIIAYLLATSLTELVAVVLSMLVGLPIPFSPLQILWANMLTEGFMNFSYAFEPKEDDVMQRNPRSASTKNIITPMMLRFVGGLGLATGLILFFLHWGLTVWSGLDTEGTRTVLFTVLSLGTIMLALPLKDLREPLRHISPFSNRYFISALGVSIAGFLATFYIAPLRSALHLTPDALTSAFPAIIIALFFFLGAAEYGKYLAFPRRGTRVLK